MKRSSIKRSFLLLIVQLLFVILPSCNSRAPVESSASNIPSFNGSCFSFKNKIPYNVLGSGKIVFEKISSHTNYKSCTYVIDVDKQHVFYIPNVASQCSPDRKDIAFPAFTNLKYRNDIYIIDTNGNNGKRFSNFIYRKKFPSWSPDGEKLLLNIYEGNLLSHNYVININGNNLTQITSKHSIIDHCISWGR